MSMHVQQQEMHREMAVHILITIKFHEEECSKGFRFESSMHLPSPAKSMAKSEKASNLSIQTIDKEKEK